MRPLVLHSYVCPAGCCCGGYAAGALWGWLCRLGLCWALRLCLAWVRLSNWMRLRRLRRRGAFGLAVPFGFGLGAWPSSCAGALILPGAAAAALPPVRFEVGCAIGFWLGAWPASRAGALILPGAAAAALPPVRFWSVLRLSLRGVLHTWEKHYPWVYRGCVNYRCTPFPLINNRPLSEGAAGASRLGEGRYIEKPSGPADAQPVLRECSLWQLWLPG